MSNPNSLGASIPRGRWRKAPRHWVVYEEKNQGGFKPVLWFKNPADAERVAQMNRVVYRDRNFKVGAH